MNTIRLRKINKYMAAFLMLTLMLALFPVSACAADSITYSEGALHYVIVDECYIAIKDYYGRDAEVYVPSSIAGLPVNEIRSGAFTTRYSLKYLNTVHLPSCITTIEEGAFPDDGSITIMYEMFANSGGYTGEYDGEPHGISVYPNPQLAAVATVTYSTEYDGEYSTDCPTLTEPGELTVYYRVAAPGYETLEGSEKIIIKEPAVSYAVIKTTSFTVSEEVVCCGQPSGTTGGNEYRCGIMVTVGAEPVEGYSFAGWYEYTGSDSDEDRSNPNNYSPIEDAADYTYSFETAEDAYYAAKYEISEQPVESPSLQIKLAEDKYSLSVNGSEEEINEDGKYYLPFGSKVEVSFTDADSRFVSWVNDSDKIVSLEENYSFTLVSYTSLEGKFIADSQEGVTIQVLSAYNQLLKASTVTEVTKLSDVLPSFNPAKQGCVFKCWSVNGKEISEDDFSALTEAIEQTKEENPVVVISPVYTEKEQCYTITVRYLGAEHEPVLHENCKAGSVVNLQADETIGDYSFAYWLDSGSRIIGYETNYRVLVNGDCEFTAVYEESKPVSQPIIVISDVKAEDGVLSITASRNVSGDYTVLENGILYTVNAESVSQLYVGGDVYSKKSLGNSNNGIFTLNIQVGTHYDRTVYARAYMVVEDSSGNRFTYYSGIFTGCYNDVTGD